MSLRIAAVLLLAIFAAPGTIPRLAHAGAVNFKLVVPRNVEVSTLLIPPGSTPAAPGSNLAFDIDPDGLPVFADGPNLKVFGSPRPLATAGSKPIEDFAWMSDGALVLLTQGRLAGLGPKGVELGPATPAPDMRVRPAGKNAAYIFGGAHEPANHDVYLFERTGRIAKLFAAPGPVTAVAGDGKTSYVATERTLIRLAEGKPAKVVLKTADPIISVDVAPQGLFYATASSVGYLSRAGVAYDFLRGAGGAVRVRGSALFLLLRDDGKVIRFKPIEAFEIGRAHV